MSWNPQQIRTLRLQLGWSAADFGRRMACSVDMVLSWEAGDATPDIEMRNQFIFLANYVEKNARRLAQQPYADELMHKEQLAQVTHDIVSARTTY